MMTDADSKLQVEWILTLPQFILGRNISDFLIAALAIQVMRCTALYFGSTSVGAGRITGIQPRYTIPFLIFVMIPVSLMPVKNEMRNWPRLTEPGRC